MEYIIKEPENPDEHRVLMDVEREIWGGDCYAETVPYHVSIALEEVGGFVLGIYEGGSGKPIGVLVTFPAIINGKPAFYSHMHGYLSGYRGRGLGFEVKKIQMSIAKSKGIDLILWTYDPLLAPNAWFNITKLGAIFRRYSPNHYGRMNIFYNRGVESDRVWAEWFIDSERVLSRVEGRFKPKSIDYFLSKGAEIVLEAMDTANGLQKPYIHELKDAPPKLILIEIPRNYVRIINANPALANVWRKVSREVFMKYLSIGYVGFEFIRERERYFYVLWREDLEKILRGEYP